MQHGVAETRITISPLVCFVVVIVPLNFLSLWMRRRVNDQLPEDRQVPWWPRNYRQVEVLYGEHNPDSWMPSLSQYGRYAALALMGAMILLGITSRGY
jgi:hypothetical protein